MTVEDCKATVDFWNRLLQSGHSRMPWQVGNVAPIWSIRAPATGQFLPLAKGGFLASHFVVLAPEAPLSSQQKAATREMAPQSTLAGVALLAAP